MGDKLLDQTQKALGELVSVEYQAIAAYDQAIADTEDSKLRRHYSRFRNDHEKQARALNSRLAELGGAPVEYSPSQGKAGLFAKITGMFGDAASVGGMVKGAEDGIRIYLEHLDAIHDSRALGIIRRNLEAKQQEVRWLEEQAHAEAEAAPDLSDKARAAAEELGKKKTQATAAVKKQVEDVAAPKRTGFLGLPVWLLLAAVAGLAFFFLRRQDDSDFSDEAFEYETTDFGNVGSESSGEGYHGISEGSTV